MLPAMVQGKGRNSIVLRAPSGYGKTFLTKIIISWLFVYHEIKTTWLPVTETVPEINVKSQIIVCDEAHTIKNIEMFYPFIDSKENFFIFMTNEYNQLKEPLLNRSLVLDFEEYKNDSLVQIIENVGLSFDIVIPHEDAIMILDYTKKYPRSVERVAEKFCIFVNEFGYPVNDIKKTMLFLGFTEGGFSKNDIKYLDFLKITETASLSTLSKALNMPKQYIEQEIEPFLLKNKLINITSKGRKYAEKN